MRKWTTDWTIDGVYQGVLDSNGRMRENACVRPDTENDAGRWIWDGGKDLFIAPPRIADRKRLILAMAYGRTYDA